MDPIDLSSFQSTEIDLPFASTTIAIFAAAIFGEWVAVLYRLYGKSLSDRNAFSDNFWLLAVTTTLVIMVVKFSIALSLGLVGALSIVRFRAAIKEPEELIYLFLVIVIGLGCGAGQTQAVLTLLLLTTVVSFSRYRWYQRRRKTSTENYSTGIILTVSGSTNDRSKFLEFLENSLGKDRYALISSNIQSASFESVYRLNTNINDELREEILVWCTNNMDENFKLRYGVQALIPQ